MKTISHLAIFVVVSFSIAEPSSIEAYGDSITAGFLTYTSVLPSQENLKVANHIMADLLQYGLSHDKKRYFLPHHRMELAWPKVLAGGVPSHTVHNLAVSGVKTQDLVNQVGNLLQTSEKAFAFFFMGHNDLCRNPRSPEAIAATFSKEFHRALKAWDEKHHRSHAFLIPVGKIHHVYELLKDSVWYQGDRKNLGCLDSWERYFPYCKQYAELLKTGELGEFLEPRIEAMNQALKDLARHWDSSDTTNRFTYLKNVGHAPYEKDFFAIDCFHLSESGQKRFATVIHDSLVSF